MISSRLLFMMALAIAMFTANPSTLAQAPANNNFANAITLSGVPVSTTGNNTNANLEASEFDPYDYGGRSVWYSWTAPSTGWFTIHTSSQIPANGLDTVLVLYSNAANLAAAPVLGHNDESGRYPDDYPEEVYPSGFGPSRLIFKANSGTVFKIAVHGYFGEQGPFNLSIAAEPTPDIYVNSVSFSPSSINVTDSEQYSDATVAIKSTFPFTDAFIELFPPLQRKRQLWHHSIILAFSDFGGAISGAGVSSIS